MISHGNIFDRLATARTTVFAVAAVFILLMALSKLLLYDATDSVKDLLDFTTAITR